MIAGAVAASALLVAGALPQRGGAELRDFLAEVVAAASDDLGPLTRRPGIDAWEVVDALCVRGHVDRAREFAAATGGELSESLSAYLAARMRARGTPEVRAVLARISTPAREDGWQAAVSALTEVLALGDRFEQVQCQLALGGVLSRAGRLSESEDAFVLAATMAEELGWSAACERGFRGAAGAARRRAGGDSDALSYWKKLVELDSVAARPRQLGILRLNIGMACAKTGALHEAESWFELASRTVADLGDDRLLFATTSASGLAASRAGRPVAALEYFEAASRVAERTGDVRLLVESEAALAEARRQLGDHEAALQFAEQAVKHARDESVGDRSRAEASGVCGVVLAAMDRAEESLRHLQQALALYEKLDDDRGIAKALTNLAWVEARRGRAERAVEIQERGLEAARRAEDPFLEAHSLAHSGEFHRLAGNLDAAAGKDAAAMALAEDLDSARIRMRVWLNMAERALLEGRYSYSLASARSCVGEMGGMLSGLASGADSRAREHRAAAFEVGVRASIELGQPEQLCVAAEMARSNALLAAMDTAHVRLTESDRQQREDADDEVRAAYRVWSSANGAARELAKTRLDSARDARDEVLARIEREARASTTPSIARETDTSDVRAALREGEAFVSFVSARGANAALVIDRNGERIVRLEVASLVENLTERLAAVTANARGERPGRDSARGWNAMRRGLRAALLTPLALDDSTERVVVSAANPFDVVPFAMLTEREVAYVPSAAVLIALRKRDVRRAAERVLAIGAPEYGSGVRALPESRKEAERVGSDVMLGDVATRDAVARAVTGSTRYRAVHFACHGVPDLQRPLRGALLLTPTETDDGRLTVLDVFQMRFQTDLVVLSACESGRGRSYRADGPLGFTRAFLQAGAQRVLVCPWKVDDLAARELMTSFYRHWKPGVAASKALRSAQNELRRQARWSDPFFWAGWQLWGVPD